MVIPPLVNLATDFIQSLLPGSSNSSSSAAASTAQSANQTSPFAQILSNIEQSSLTQYKNVTQQIGSYLQTGAQSATANGDPGLASQLTQLSADFTNASITGQLPSF